jgi:ArsR family transcriptional regulator, arsenate/arsenite/antimonite-responsive transcriptional repressor / arsenate reductase (thioredoxin)
MSTEPLRVLFLCTANAARSQMAEGLLRHLSDGRAAVFSAGSMPASEIHPQARAVMEEKFSIDTSGMHPKSMTSLMGERFDYVITVCDRIAERCPVFPGDPERIHWSFEDPLLQPTPEAQQRACEHVANALLGRLRIWMSLPDVRRRLETVPAR